MYFNSPIFFTALVNVCLSQDHSKYCARDCQDVKELGFTESGLYHVKPMGTFGGFYVYCDMDTDGGGWLVFQRRIDGSVDFYKDWIDYELGFGNVTHEHWLGNLALYIITNQGRYEIRIDLEDWEGNTTFANYRIFRIRSPENLYSLQIFGYTGTAGDSLGGHNTQYFSTRNKDHDNRADLDCAERFHGSWWYTACHTSNLNGRYVKGSNDSLSEGLIWSGWMGMYYSLKTTEMKLRRI